MSCRAVYPHGPLQEDAGPSGFSGPSVPIDTVDGPGVIRLPGGGSVWSQREQNMSLDASDPNLDSAITGSVPAGPSEAFPEFLASEDESSALVSAQEKAFVVALTASVQETLKN